MRAEGLKARKMKLKNPDLQETVARPEKFIQAYRAKQKNYVQQKKLGLKPLNEDIKGQVIIAVRLKGDKNLTDRQKILLKTLKLKRVHEAAVIKVTPKIEKIFRICEPFITYG